MTQIEPVGFVPLAPFLCSAPHPLILLSFGGIGIVKTCTKKFQKAGFSKAISPLCTLPNAIRLFFALPMPSPQKSLTKSARAAGNPGFFKQIAPFFEKSLSAEAKLDVCPRRGVNEGAREGRLGRKSGQDSWANVCVFRRTPTVIVLVSPILNMSTPQ